MQTNFKNSSNKPGVYKIINLTNGKVYIGSAKNFSVRYSQHIKSLKANKHQNKHLQAAFNKNGSDNFLFEVVEVLEDSIKEYRFQIEQEYINEYLGNWDLCYNFNKKSIQKERSCFSKNPEETKSKQSERSKRMWQNPEYLAKNPCGSSEEKSKRIKKRWEENREVMLIQLLRETPARKKYREKFGTINTKTYSNVNLVNPNTGEIIKEITNLSEFCRQNNILDSASILPVIQGKVKQYKGWHILGIKINPNIKLREFEQKVCSKCKVIKPLTEFFKRADKTNGYRSKCKVCFK